MRHDDLVERPLHVEHHRVEGAALRAVDGLDAPGGVVELGQPHRLGQPTGRVDREHHDAAPALGGAQGQRRGGRRLADTTGAGADQDLRGVEDRVDVHGRAGGHRVIPWDSSAAASS